MAILKTYLLAPNFTTHLGANIQLGTIIANPFRPNKWVGQIPLNIETDTHVEYEKSITPGVSASTHVNIFAKFLEIASGTIGLQKDKSILDHYTMDTLETISYKRDITDDEAAELVRANSKLQEIMNSGILGSVPVYIVTGLKVAKGFHLTSEIAKSKGANIGADIPVTDQVSAGAELSVSQTKTLSEQSSTTQDIVFAYQLHAVANKGWWKKRRVNVDVYAPKAAALGQDDRITEDAVVVAAATTEDLEEAQFDYGDVTITEHAAQEAYGNKPCVCVAFKDQT